MRLVASFLGKEDGFIDILCGRIALVWHVFIKEIARQQITFLIICNVLKSLLDNTNPLFAFLHKVRSLDDCFVQASVKFFIVSKHTK